MKALFPEWKEDDLQAVLDDVKEDLEAAVTRISAGDAEQWSAVGKKPKAKVTFFFRRHP